MRRLTTNIKIISLFRNNLRPFHCSVRLFQFNFVGRILGPRGMTAKQLEQETGCKIMVRGKGSMRDKKKVCSCLLRMYLYFVCLCVCVSLISSLFWRAAQLTLRRTVTPPLSPSRPTHDFSSFFNCFACRTTFLTIYNYNFVLDYHGKFAGCGRNIALAGCCSLKTVRGIINSF